VTKEELLSFFRSEIAVVDEAMRGDLRAIEDPLLKEIIDYVIFSGGKRIRPLLTIFGARLAGGTTPVHEAAIAFE